MGMEAAILFRHQIREALKGSMTAEDLEKVETAMQNVLCDYDITARDMREDGEDMMLTAYLDALRIEGRSVKTIDRYGYVIRKLEKSAMISARMMTVHHIRKYLAAEKARGIGDSSLNGERQVFSAFFGWLHREGMIELNPMNNIGPIKCPKKERAAFSDVEYEKLKNHCKAKRDLAIICFLYSTGCRINEMVQLNRADVDLNRLECKVLGKGNKERRVYMDSVAGMAMTEYLNERTDGEEALFTGRGCQRLQAGCVRIMMRKLARRAGVTHVHPHKFRRTRATNLIRHGMPIQEVAAILGHDKLDTTMKYIVLDQSQIKSSYQRYA